MPIVFVHGVANRDQDAGYAENTRSIALLLQRFVAPVIAPDPHDVRILFAYWGDLGARFAWGGDSRPRSPLLGQGGAAEPSQVQRAIAVAEHHQAVADLPLPPAQPADTGGLIAGGDPTTGAAIRLADLDPDQLSDLLVAVALQIAAGDEQQAMLALAADDVAHASTTHDQLAQCRDSAEELALLQSLVADRYQQLLSGQLVGQGAAGWLGELGSRLGEAVGRADDLPGFLLTRAAAEARRPLNSFVTLFLGDVLNYIGKRGTAERPGQIPARVMDTLAEARDEGRQRGGEPLIVLSHSMGGQIVYDLLTTFLPQTSNPRYAGIRVDFWCATASQVGLFEEMKLFLASSALYGKDVPPAAADRAPFPDRRYLGGWWNVWDHNDFISFSAADIFAGIDDEPYNSGMSGAAAHSGYLAYPSFFRGFASKLTAARDQNWWRP